MVLNRIRDAIAGPPTLEGPSILPSYFPVEPQGCEKFAQRLFDCLLKDATDKARDMEKAGYWKSQYPNVDAERLKKLKEDEKSTGAIATPSGDPKAVVVYGTQKDANISLPSPGDNPLDECRTLIAYYKRCCDRELKKKKNWMLTEPYRVQEEYRYEKSVGGAQSTE